EGDVRVFLGLGDAELLQARRRDDFAEGVLQFDGGEDDGAAVGLVVFGEGDVGCLRETAPVEAGEVLLQEGEAELASAVGAEVEEENDVAVANAALADLAEDEGFEEFVRLPLAVFFRDGGGGRVAAGLALAEDDGVPGELGA